MENNGIRAKGTYRDIENTDCDLILEWNSIIAKENAKDESIRYFRFICICVAMSICFAFVSNFIESKKKKNIVETIQL